MDSFINNTKIQISKNKNNDQIFESLESLSRPAHKAPDEILAIVDIVLERKKANKPKVHKIGDGIYEGKTYKDLVLKCINLLKEIQYLKPKEVFNCLIGLYYNPDSKIKTEAKDSIEKLAEYNMMVLEKIGVITQRKILDVILSWDNEKKIRNIEIIELVAYELFKTTVEGVSMADYKTMRFRQGALNKTERIEKIRQDTIKLLFELYDNSRDLKLKLNILKTLSGASHLPGIGKDSENLFSVVVDNIKILVDCYKDIVFIDNKLITEFPIIHEIEEQLVWFNKNHKKDIAEITRLLEKIKKNEFYSIFRTLVGDRPDLDEISWEAAEEKNRTGADKIFKSINKDNIKEWDDKLNIIAQHREVVDDWKFKKYKGLLSRLAKEKPELTEIILKDIFGKKNKKPIRRFVDSFLFGFREVNNTKLWDKYVAKIINDENIEMIAGIFGSFWIIKQKDIKSLVRKTDIELFIEAIKGQKRFEFLNSLKKKDKNKLISFHNVLIQALLHVYNNNPKEVEELIIKEIKNNPSSDYLNMYITQLSMAEYRKSTDMSKWKPENINFILSKLINLRVLDYNAQSLMLAMGEKCFKEIMNVFKQRIERGEEIGKKRNRKIGELSRYEVIPYHFNGKFKEFLIAQPEYPKILKKWIEKMNLTKQISNWDLGHLIHRIGGPVNEILSATIEKGNKESLLKVIDLFELMAAPSFELCFKIIENTDIKKISKEDMEDIWQRVETTMYGMEVVMGEYGIANAYENKLEEVKEYEKKYREKDDKKVLRFIKRVKKNLKDNIIREKQRTEEEIQLRKMEFERAK